jgi:hypothetical protein
MASEDDDSAAFRRILIAGVGSILLLLAIFGGWFLTRRISPGGFVVRIAPSGIAPGGLVLSLLGPGGGKLSDWRFLDVPGPSVLQGLEKKIPWAAVATNASHGQPCLTLETAPFVPETAVAPVLKLAVAQCCPGLTDVSRCPVKRVVLGR